MFGGMRFGNTELCEPNEIVNIFADLVYFPVIW